MSHDRGLRAAVRRLRRAVRRRTSLWLARRSGTPEPIRAPLPTPRRILVCRVNRRLGNCLFLTPLLRSLATTYPHARIDVVLRGRANAGLIRGLPAVRHVYTLPDRPLASLPGLLRILRRVRRQRYDLAIDPNGHSSSNRAALALCRARYRLGFAGRNQWLRLTHAAPLPRREPHQARQALHLLTDAIADTEFKLHRELAVFPDSAARRRGERLLHTALGRQAETWPLIGFFAGATGKKQLPASWWQSWCAAMRTHGAPLTLVQIVPPGGAAIDPDIATVSSDNLVDLAAAIGRMDGFVAADSGPMHLAAAAGTPTIGLFRSTDPQRYAPLGRAALTLAGDQLAAGTVARCAHDHLEALRSAA